MQVAAAMTEVIDNALLATDPTGGHVAIHTAFDPYSSRVAITVTDNGCGMDETTLKRAFDPFFSSKPAGRRRGMGLAQGAAMGGIERRLDANGKQSRRRDAHVDFAPDCASRRRIGGPARAQGRDLR